MKDIKTIIRDLRKSNIRLSLQGENIEIDGDLTAEMLLEIRQFKEQIIAYLKQNTSTVSFNRIAALSPDSDYSLSSSQRRLWILGQFEEINAAYNIARAYVIEGPLNVKVLEEAFHKLVERHESLRTIFTQDENGEPRQVILDPEDRRLKMVYEPQHTLALSSAELSGYVNELSFRPFDLSADALIRIHLCACAPGKWVLVYVMHHIISDAWSMGILLNELLYFYRSLTEAGLPPLKPLAIHYKDYAAWQQLQLQQPQMSLHRDYWLAKMEGELPVLDMGSEKLRPLVKTYNGGVLSRRINSGLTTGIKNLSQANGATLFVGLLSVVYALLHRYSNQDDIIIGTPVAGRDHVDLEQQIGFYINTLALRIRFEEGMSFETLLRTVRQTMFEAHEHQSYPFDELVAELDLKRDPARNFLFDVMVMLQNTKLDQPQMTERSSEIMVSSYDGSGNVVSKFDLGFGFIETGDEIHLNIEYNSDLYSAMQADQLASHFEQLMMVVITNPESTIQEVDFLSKVEKQLLLVDFNGNNTSSVLPKTVVDLFEDQARKQPGKIAIEFNDQQLTYCELNQLANRYCRYLQENKQLGRGDLVAVKLERSQWLIVALLGILKSGAAYLPIDPLYPQQKIDFMISDSKCKAVIDKKAIDLFSGKADAYSAENINASVSSDMAYVIYTSGSTGFPKGCVITNANLAAYIGWANSYYFKDGIPASFGLFTSLSFDLTVTSIFCPLTQGGKIHIYHPDEELYDILKHSFSEKSGINSIKLTPSHINVLSQLNLRTNVIKYAIVGGEEVTTKQVEALKNIHPEIRVYNEYGPTEGTVGCVAKELHPNQPVMIGKPASHASIYVLNSKSALCPIGVIGEICIGGDGVSSGYLFNTSLTTEKFINDPFVADKKMYRTGDLGRWSASGELAFLGRMDHQVKVRGYRIEIEEIEMNIAEIDGIENVVVLVKLNPEGDKELAAYIVCKDDLDMISIRKSLSSTLPAYMIPDHFIRVETIPLTINGKVDKGKLAAMESGGKEKDPIIAPRNEIEEKILEIWSEILPRQDISVLDNFFLLGGNSLKAMKLLTCIHKEFNVKIKLADLFKYTTIEEISKDISRKIWARQAKEVQDADLTTEQNFIL